MLWRRSRKTEVYYNNRDNCSRLGRSDGRQRLGPCVLGPVDYIKILLVNLLTKTSQIFIAKVTLYSFLVVSDYSFFRNVNDSPKK